MKNKKVCIIGGDKRQFYLAKELSEKGYTIKNSIEEVQDSSLLLLPIPVSVDGITIKAAPDSHMCITLEKLTQEIVEGQIVFGGKIPEIIKAKCKEVNANFVDYMELEAITLLNTIATAEGAILEAILHSEENLQGSQCLIIGYGRCGETLADKVSGLKGNVSIMARREDARIKAEIQGYKAVSMFSSSQYYFEYDFIFNTVPDLVVTHEVIDRLKKEVLIIDIASNPGGVDFEYCRKSGITAKHCLGLPGKYAPKASARFLADAILTHL